jgi:hypothetical protein
MKLRRRGCADPDSVCLFLTRAKLRRWRFADVVSAQPAGFAKSTKVYPERSQYLVSHSKSSPNLTQSDAFCVIKLTLNNIALGERGQIHICGLFAALRNVSQLDAQDRPRVVAISGNSIWYSFLLDICPHDEKLRVSRLVLFRANCGSLRTLSRKTSRYVANRQNASTTLPLTIEL